MPGSEPRAAFFWGTYAGAEIDLVLFRAGRRYDIEFKSSAASDMTKSLHITLADLKLDRAWIVYLGAETYRVRERVEGIPLHEIMKALRRPSKR
jgi:hypothetical protein